MASEQCLDIFQFTLAGIHERLGTVTLRDEKLNYSSARVQAIVESLRDSHFSLKATDTEIYDELPFIFRGFTYCQRTEASNEFLEES
jgi:hypothetical protein